MAGQFQGRIGLSCGHWWSGEVDTRADAEEFLFNCIATGDGVMCRQCDGKAVDIVGPLEEVK